MIKYLTRCASDNICAIVSSFSSQRVNSARGVTSIDFLSESTWTFISSFIISSPSLIGPQRVSLTLNFDLMRRELLGPITMRAEREAPWSTTRWAPGFSKTGMSSSDVNNLIRCDFKSMFSSLPEAKTAAVGELILPHDVVIRKCSLSSDISSITVDIAHSEGPCDSRRVRRLIAFENEGASPSVSYSVQFSR